MPGQPDSVAISPDERYAAIVIENERDEDVNDGLIPQLPAGLAADPRPARRCALRTVRADRPGRRSRPSDPEPEYVDINRRNEAVVSLQENNHLAIVDLAQGRGEARLLGRQRDACATSTRPRRSSARRSRA